MPHSPSCKSCRRKGHQTNRTSIFPAGTVATPPRAKETPRNAIMQNKQYDRAAQDIGNIVNLGHVNVCISDQHIATHYYVSGLGLTRDPFLNTGAGNMWINVGMSQFHLPMGTPEVVRGTTGLVMPDRR